MVGALLLAQTRRWRGYVRGAQARRYVVCGCGANLHVMFGFQTLGVVGAHSALVSPNQALQPTSPKMRSIFGAAAELGC